MSHNVLDVDVRRHTASRTEVEATCSFSRRCLFPVSKTSKARQNPNLPQLFLQSISTVLKLVSKQSTSELRGEQLKTLIQGNMKVLDLKKKELHSAVVWRNILLLWQKIRYNNGFCLHGIYECILDSDTNQQVFKNLHYYLQTPLEELIIKVTHRSSTFSQCRTQHVSERKLQQIKATSKMTYHDICNPGTELLFALSFIMHSPPPPASFQCFHSHQTTPFCACFT